MMSVRGKILWAASAVLLVFLYLASSTDLIIKEKVREIHTVSIVLDDVNDTYYQNFKKGVDQAARDYYADTSYITLYEEVSQEEQTKLVDREVGDGADAVVVIPVDAEEFQGAIQGKWPETPLVVLGAGEDHPGVNARIYVDNFQAGRLLAEKALGGPGSGFSPPSGRRGGRTRSWKECWMCWRARGQSTRRRGSGSSPGRTGRRPPRSLRRQRTSSPGRR